MEKNTSEIMSEYLVRGFHTKANGTVEITLNGEKIKGEWVKGYYSREKLGREHVAHYITPLDEVGCWDRTDYEVLPETVGQYTVLSVIKENKAVAEKAVREFAEELKQVFDTKHTAVMANVVRCRVDELIKERYGEE